jgi:hypothetical protein
MLAKQNLICSILPIAENTREEQKSSSLQVRTQGQDGEEETNAFTVTMTFLCKDNYANCNLRVRAACNRITYDAAGSGG